MAGGEGDVKLLGLRLSPFVARVRMALDAKGVRYEYVEEELAAKSGLLLASNPVHRKVPVLIHAGRPVCELFPAWGRVMMAATEEERAERAERAGEAAGMVARLEEAFAGCSDGGDAVGYLDLDLGIPRAGPGL